MDVKNHLNVLWTTDNPVTAQHMVFMYTINGLKLGWWESVTLILWGASPLLVSRDSRIRELVEEAREAGVHISACKACADELGVTESLARQGIEVIYWGTGLTRILQNGEKLLSV